MSAFRVGQRVRIKWCDTWPHFAGQETVITEALSEHLLAGTGETYWCYGVELHPNFGPRPDQLEPLTPEGWQPVEWSECLWQPEGIAA